MDEINISRTVNAGESIPISTDVFNMGKSTLYNIGGMAGVVLSHIFGYILSTGTEETVFLGMYFSADMKMIIPLWLDLAAIGIAIFIGVIAGIFPSKKATNMSPFGSYTRIIAFVNYGLWKHGVGNGFGY